MNTTRKRNESLSYGIEDDSYDSFPPPAKHRNLTAISSIGIVSSESRPNEFLPNGMYDLLNRPQALPISHDQCKLRGCSRPRYVDLVTGVQYDCCGKSHSIALKWQKLFVNSEITQTSTAPMYQGGKLSSWNNYYPFQQQNLIAGPNESTKQCLLPGCGQFRFPNRESLFCTNRTHKSIAENLVLLELAPDQQKYTKTADYFINQWDPIKSCPPLKTDIATIFRIFNPKQQNVFKQYTSSLSNPATERYFHGTLIKCDAKGQKFACSDLQCGVCGISKRGFELSRIGSNIPRFMRFGKGFYLAPNSSKCHDYTQGIVDYRVMLLCKVAPGNKYIVQYNQPKLYAPPPGYDSVYGAKGRSLNYDEIVLYKSESILPKYAIVYKRGGIGKIAQ